jgi:hypothetical protein
MTEHDDALPELDLGVLGEGVDPSPGQWDAISAVAAHRRRRRSVVLGAAAVLILIAGTATVLLSRSNDEGVRLATGTGGGAAFVVPPKGSTTVEAALSDDGGYRIRYEDSGETWALHSVPSSSNATLVRPSPNLVIDSERFNAVELRCGDIWDPSTGTSTPAGASFASFVVGSNEIVLVLSGGIEDGECVAEGRAATAIAQQVDRLRVVGIEALGQYLGIDDGEVVSPPTSAAHGLLPPSTTTTAPEDDPAKLGNARAQIEAAVRGFNVPAADGTWPYLEDGVARAEEYRERQELAWQQSGLTAMGDQADMVQEVVSITFESPTSAQVDFQITVTLQSGRQTWPHHGRFILEDGVWKMSRESNLQISGLACSAPQPDAEACGTTGG